MRNVLVHEYFGVDIEEVWKTGERDLLTFKRAIEELPQSIGGPRMRPVCAVYEQRGEAARLDAGSRVLVGRSLRVLSIFGQIRWATLNLSLGRQTFSVDSSNH